MNIMNDIQKVMNVHNLYDEMKRTDYMQNNTIYLDDEIDREVINALSRQLKKLGDKQLGLSTQDRTPIKLIISSCGGEVYSTFYFCDLMEYYISRGVEIHTYVTSYAYSGAFKIAICGSRRYGYKRTKYMCHQQNWFEYGYTTRQDAKRKYEKSEELFNELVDLITSKTKITRDMLEDYSNRNDDWYMGSTDALEMSVIDEIII